MTGLQQMQQDPRSNEELLAVAIAAAERGEDDAAIHRMWEALSVLHARGTRDALEAGIALCASPDAKRRQVGAHLLGQLGSPQRTFPEECCDSLLSLTCDPEPQVVSAAAFALGHLGNRRCEPDLLALKGHPSDDVRHGVAFALVGSESREVVAALLEMMDDPYEHVRDWSTTSIAQTLSLDGPNIREALLRRAEDPDYMTRAEALNGLARRRDSRVVPYLAAELEDENGNLLYFLADAAKVFLGIDETVEMEPAELLRALRQA